MTEYSDESLARAVYRLANARMQAAGGSFSCSEAVFAVRATSAPNAVSFATLQSLDNADFLQATYLTLLQRPVDDGARAAWSQHGSEPAEAFQTALLSSVLQSAEYQSHPVLLEHCPLPVAAQAPQISVQVVTNGLPNRMIRLYQRMPHWLQRLAKRIAGKGQG